MLRSCNAFGCVLRLSTTSNRAPLFPLLSQFLPYPPPSPTQSNPTHPVSADPQIRPNVDWNKGKAVLFLLDALGLSPTGSSTAPTSERPSGGPSGEAPSGASVGTPVGTFAVYLGDDNSDEDAFNALQESGLGVGIVVASRGKASAARYSVRGPTDVQAFFHRLLELQAAAA